MPVITDPKKKRDIVIIRPCVVEDADGKSEVKKKGTKVTVSISDANFLIGAKKAVKPEDYKPEVKKEEEKKK